MGEQEKRAIGRKGVRNRRRFWWMNCHAKRLVCVRVAGAAVRRGTVRRREQAHRAPNASRSSVAALPCCALVPVRLGGYLRSGYWLIVFILGARLAADLVHQLDEGQEHGDHDAADDNGQENDHDRLQQGGHGGHGIIDFVVIVVGDLEEHLRESAGLLAYVHHADDHGGKDAGGFERGRDGFALFDALVHGPDGVADDDVAGGLSDDGEGLQDGDAAADQSAQGAGKPGDGNLADDGPDDRHLELELVKSVAAKLGADEKHEEDHEDGQAADRVNEVILDDVADAEHQPGEGRQLGVVQHAREDFLEAGDDIHHEDAQNDHGDDHHGDRIKHGRDDLAFDLLGLLHEFRQAVEHDFEHATQLARFDHVDKKPVEDFGMLGQAFGEGAAAFDRHGQLGDDGLQGGVPLLLFQIGR